MKKILLGMLIIMLMSAGSLLGEGQGEGQGQGEVKAEKIVLKAADDHAMDYPTTQGLVRMGDLLKEWTNGRITVEVYAAGQLGSEKETIEQTQMGAIDIDRISIGHLSAVVPEMNVFSLPYIFRSAEHAFKVCDGPVGEELLATCEAHNLIGLGYYDSGQRSFYNTKKPVKSIADLKGMKIRVMGADIFSDMANALGAAATPMAFEEVYTALQTGVIDGAENNYPSYIEKGHYEAAKYYTQDEHLRVPEIIVFSKKTWNKLSSEDQALIKKAALESVPYQRSLWQKSAEEAKNKAIAAGCEIITDIDKQPFIDAMKPVYEKYAPDLAEYIAKIQAVK